MRTFVLRARAAPTDSQKLLAAIGQAYADSIPMLVVSGQVKRELCISTHGLPGLRQIGDQEAGAVTEILAAVPKRVDLVASASAFAEPGWVFTAPGSTAPLRIRACQGISAFGSTRVKTPSPASRTTLSCTRLAMTARAAHQVVIAAGYPR